MRWKTFLMALITVVMLGFCAGPVSATQMQFEFRHPAFGGPPLNGQWRLQEAKTQDPYGMLDDDSGWDGPEEKTAQEKLEEAFQRRLRYKLVDSTLDQMFDENEDLRPGEYQLGDTTITIEESGNMLEVTIGTSSGTTTITIPQ